MAVARNFHCGQRFPRTLKDSPQFKGLCREFADRRAAGGVLEVFLEPLNRSLESPPLGPSPLMLWDELDFRSSGEGFGASRPFV